MVPAGAVAAVMMVALIAVGPAGGVAETEATISDSGAFTYRDYTAQATLVWFSYPAENEFAEGSAADTVQ